jgi:hypothetical protein
MALVLAYEEEEPELYRLTQAGDLVELLRHLERGRSGLNPKMGLRT